MAKAALVGRAWISGPKVVPQVSHSMSSPSTFMGISGMKKTLNQRRACLRAPTRSTPHLGQWNVERLSALNRVVIPKINSMAASAGQRP